MVTHKRDLARGSDRADFCGVVPRGDDEPAEATKASHEVMGLVRGNSELSHLVLRLRDAAGGFIKKE